MRNDTATDQVDGDRDGRSNTERGNASAHDQTSTTHVTPLHDNLLGAAEINRLHATRGNRAGGGGGGGGADAGTLDGASLRDRATLGSKPAQHIEKSIKI